MLVPRRIVASAAGALILVLGAQFSASAGGQAPVGCAPYPVELSPKGGSAARFTMLIRINKLENVGDYVAFNAARGQFRERDVFVVNTRFRGSSPTEAEEIVGRLRRFFPCNRIIALNGLGSDPARPGYALSLIERPELWAVMLDWEQRDWRAARATDPGLSSWKRRFGRSLGRLRARLEDLADDLDATLGGARRTGAIPSFYHDWNYGRLAKALDHHNRRFGHRRGGLQAVATQAACKRKKRGGDTAGIRKATGKLFRQYGRHKRKKRNLALQISFSDEAKAKRHLPVRSVNEARAAKCVTAGLQRGAGAFLFWAAPESMTAFFATSRFSKLREGP